MAAVRSESKKNEYHVYVVELDFEKIKSDESALDMLKKKNRRVRKREEAFYVGVSAHSAKCRFRQHKFDPLVDSEFICKCGCAKLPSKTKKSNRLVKEFGLRLRPEFYSHLIPAYSRKDGELLEGLMAKHLQKKGFAVYTDQLPNIKREKKKRKHSKKAR
jgi:hypothetical protein